MTPDEQQRYNAQMALEQMQRSAKGNRLSHNELAALFLFIIGGITLSYFAIVSYNTYNRIGAFFGLW